MTRRIHISRDIVFDEAAQWTWSAEHNVDPGEFIIQEFDPQEPAVITTTSTKTTSIPAAGSTSGSSSAAPSSSSSPPVMDRSMANAPTSGFASTTSSPQPQQGIEFASPPSVGFSEQLDADHDDGAPLRFRYIDNVLGESAAPGLAAWELEERLLLASDAEPTSYEEALLHECWRHAMLDEMTSIEASGTWELVELPLHARPIGLKWVYKTKKDTAGVITKHKARLVAKGYVQRQGVDFDEVFAPVARLESVRLLLAHAASEGWAVHHMDVKSAFLNGVLQEEVYVE
jgi:hypothetical protein